MAARQAAPSAPPSDIIYMPIDAASALVMIENIRHAPLSHSEAINIAMYLAQVQAAPLATTTATATTPVEVAVKWYEDLVDIMSKKMTVDMAPTRALYNALDLAFVLIYSAVASKYKIGDENAPLRQISWTLSAIQRAITVENIYDVLAASIDKSTGNNFAAVQQRMRASPFHQHVTLQGTDNPALLTLDSYARYLAICSSVTFTASFADANVDPNMYPHVDARMHPHIRRGISLFSFVGPQAYESDADAAVDDARAITDLSTAIVRPTARVVDMFRNALSPNGGGNQEDDFANVEIEEGADPMELFDMVGCKLCDKFKIGLVALLNSIARISPPCVKTRAVASLTDTHYDSMSEEIARTWYALIKPFAYVIIDMHVGLELELECYELLAAGVDDHPTLGPNTTVIAGIDEKLFEEGLIVLGSVIEARMPRKITLPLRQRVADLCAGTDVIRRASPQNMAAAVRANPAALNSIRNMVAVLRLFCIANKAGIKIAQWHIDTFYRDLIGDISKKFDTPAVNAQNQHGEDADDAEVEVDIATIQSSAIQHMSACGMDMRRVVLAQHRVMTAIGPRLRRIIGNMVSLPSLCTDDYDLFMSDNEEEDEPYTAGTIDDIIAARYAPSTKTVDAFTSYDEHGF